VNEQPEIKEQITLGFKSGWRYQAVYIEDGNKKHSYSICEVYFDDNGKLETWTASKAIAAFGESVEELTNDLHYMLDDVQSWKPVPFDSLKVGMEFEHT
jgi:hypothetical protein